VRFDKGEKDVKLLMLIQLKLKWDQRGNGAIVEMTTRG